MRRVEHVMGFPVSLRIDDEDVPERAADAVFAWLREVDERFSPFVTGSEVSRHGRGELGRHELSEDLVEVLGLCEHYRLATDGAFDAWLPGRGFDPCAVVKGWSVERGAQLLRASGVRRFCLNAGGDVVVAGGPWRTGVRHPERADRLCATLELTDGAVATSARYERGDHIIDGRTGHPATGLLSMTVVAATLTEADSVATAAFAMGAEGVEWAASLAGCEVFAVVTGGQVLRTAGFPVAGEMPAAA
ncbi:MULTISPECIES: FAD:protein FMN transferase [Streptomyces]|uniref:FAD:protein FMN transferase n=1 Tax=Streptomyces glycanivorans TaxID=3033808 RepID=A0ABY9JAF9_9ACTN|nr:MULTISPECIES: FAD:protein FMN transferase [unclassified Streptomyces]TXS19798.1 FAD:protein FMN transferase [Streptomyces sp. wa22]WLQ63656.1 FAD:protein FMN transferase [Streptomyces sp. Alt3]WSQ77041.1 FAD:protein FMN transferase [Streptomyces sp. NBC_01213]WSQ84369.1 FAD:protein FMN transferase [Streptomyces sp. NBC_01212]